MAKPQQQKTNPQVRTIEQRWTKALTEAGWTALPFVILSHQRRLGLDPLALNILLQLAKHWWEPGNPPFPSKTSIAAEIGVNPRAVQRRIAQMEAVGLTRREERRSFHGGSKTNVYHFDGLIEKAKPYAREVVKKREEARMAREGRRRGGQPRLRVVDSE